jgi:hypothetical protein
VPNTSSASELCVFGREDRHPDQQHDEAERDHRDLVPAQAAPEQLHRRARRDLLLGAALLDDDRLVLGLVDEADGIAGAHASDLTVGGAIRMLLSLLRPAGPCRMTERSPEFPLQDYDSCLRPR